jgi:hypothetical protein
MMQTDQSADHPRQGKTKFSISLSHAAATRLQWAAFIRKFKLHERGRAQGNPGAIIESLIMECLPEYESEDKDENGHTLLCREMAELGWEWPKQTETESGDAPISLAG